MLNQWHEFFWMLLSDIENLVQFKSDSRYTIDDIKYGKNIWWGYHVSFKEFVELIKKFFFKTRKKNMFLKRFSLFTLFYGGIWIIFVL